MPRYRRAALTMLVAAAIQPGASHAEGRPAPAGAAGARIEFVATPAWPALRGRAPAGVLVIDVEGLESAEAAGTLAQSWRQRLGAAAAIDCWLRPGAGTRSASLLAEVAHVLVEQGCNRVRVPV